MKNNTENIRNKSIVEYLAKCGYTPVNKTGKYRSYYSILTREGNPSMKVNTATNRWHDYSAKKGGSIIDLVMAMENMTFREAVKFLEEENTVHKVEYVPTRSEPGVKIHSVLDITDEKLISYFVADRKINKDVLLKYCKQVEFSFPMGKNPDKSHVAVGFKTFMNSWELRSSWIKICSPPKSFSLVKGRSRDVNIFEGYTDFLSYMTFYGLQEPEYDTYILNGVGQINLIKPFVSGKKIYYWGDNDTAGDEVFMALDGVTDMRYLYGYYNDFNQFLCDE
jgi:hypothetical protein